MYGRFELDDRDDYDPPEQELTPPICPDDEAGEAAAEHG